MPAPPTSTVMSAPRPPVSFSASLSAARALDLHDVAGLEVADLDQRVPRRDRGAGKRRALFKTQMGRQLHDTFFFQHRELGQHPVDRAAHRRGHRALADGAAEPALHEAARDPVADLDAADAGPDRDHFARAVRQRDQVGLGRRPRILRLDGEQIAIVERGCLDLHQHLPRTGCRGRPLDEGERVDALGGGDHVTLHRLAPVSAGASMAHIVKSRTLSSRTQRGTLRWRLERSLASLGMTMLVVQAGGAIVTCRHPSVL